MKERVMILGGSGYVGSAILHFLQGQDISFVNLSRKEIDYTQPNVLRDYLSPNKFSFLINCAGYTGKPTVDECEKHKAEALFANAVLPGIIREACEENKLPWGHVSSGCIYDGRNAQGNPFVEEDAPNFCFRSNRCSFYSGTKALGEEILNGAENCYIWRLRIPFDHVDSPRNYLTKLMRYERLLDVENSVSHVGEFARAIWQSWEKRIPFGTYNVTNPGVITAREVVAHFKKHGMGRASYDFVTPDQFEKEISPVPRSNCVIDSSKIHSTGIVLTEVHEAIDRALENWQTLR